MIERSSERKCCCMNGFCRKLTSESACVREGGKVVDSCSECK